MDMEKLMAGLFDLQRFEGSPALRRVIDEVEARYFGAELSDDALSTLSAAGDPYSRFTASNEEDGSP